ncbi:MAG: hypothetical protein PW786_02850 [Arachidicoccus sp.]|nr:hypothetical protein [Arachidicoccus sp.]
MALTIVGTMAFDAIETPFAKTDKTIGGSATFGAFAASNFTNDINQVSIVGYDFPSEVLEELNELGVKTDGVEIVKDKKSFFWSGIYHTDMNTRDTLVTDLECIRRFQPYIAGKLSEYRLFIFGKFISFCSKIGYTSTETQTEIYFVGYHEFLDEYCAGRFA